MSKQLMRSNENKILAGVCSGIAEYFEIDPVIVRIIWMLSIFTGIGVIAYIICWIIMPERKYRSIGSHSELSSEPVVDKEKSRTILGITLIVVGLLFMMDKFFKWFDMDIIIPVGIIAIGIFVLFRARR